jgi:modulator of FtsH protease HflK
MRADFQNYRSAAAVSLKGLVFQAMSALGMLAYAAWAKDSAGYTASVFVAMGVVAWLTLFIVYDQHRRERIEAMEAEALAAAPGGGTSVFESREDFRPAAKRLAGLYRFFVPIVSIAMGVVLVGVGVWRFLQAIDIEPVGNFISSKPGWALGLGISVAALGFVGARYVAGLSKQAVWTNLRGGAAWTIGSSLAWLLLALAHLIDYIGPDWGVKFLPHVVAGLMVLVGVETFANFLLMVYRPRRAGETPRPAFDSNVLALFATPDRVVKSVGGAISYQLGFDVTKGWLYQLLSKRLSMLAGVGLAVVWLLTCVVIVQPHQEAMILRWGAPIRTEVQPGFHFKAPWPIDSVYVPEYFARDDKGRLKLRDRTVTGLRRIELGTNPPATTEPILWTNDHIGDEIWQYVRIDDRGRGTGLTDIAVISAEIPMQYTVSDVRLFDELAPPEQRDQYLRSVARREVTRFFQKLTLDEVLGGDRGELSSRLRAQVQAALDRLNPDPKTGQPRGAGISINYLAITGVHPPKDVAPAFETPVQAAQRREANIASAQTEAARRLTEVVGDTALADRIVAEIAAHDAINARLKGAAGPDRAALTSQLAEQEIKITSLLQSAGGSASATLSAAKATRWNKHMSARREAVRYAGQLAFYTAAPEVFELARYYETLREAMRGARLYIVPDSPADRRFDLDLSEKDVGFDIFRSKDSN